MKLFCLKIAFFSLILLPRTTTGVSKPQEKDDDEPEDSDELEDEPDAEQSDDEINDEQEDESDEEESDEEEPDDGEPNGDSDAEQSDGTSNHESDQQDEMNQINNNEVKPMYAHPAKLTPHPKPKVAVITEMGNKDTDVMTSGIENIDGSAGARRSIPQTASRQIPSHSEMTPMMDLPLPTATLPSILASHVQVSLSHPEGSTLTISSTFMEVVDPLETKLSVEILPNVENTEMSQLPMFHHQQKMRQMFQPSAPRRRRMRRPCLKRSLPWLRQSRFQSNSPPTNMVENVQALNKDDERPRFPKLNFRRRYLQNLKSENKKLERMVRRYGDTKTVNL